MEKEENKKDLWQQLWEDDMFYGECVVKIEEDGTMTRIHPLSIKITEDGEGIQNTKGE